MKLSEALKEAKLALAWEAEDDPCTTMECDRPLCRCLQCKTSQLIEAVEAHLEAQKKEADIILGVAELWRWGGSE